MTRSGPQGSRHIQPNEVNEGHHDVHRHIPLSLRPRLIHRGHHLIRDHDRRPVDLDGEKGGSSRDRCQTECRGDVLIYRAARIGSRP